MHRHLYPLSFPRYNLSGWRTKRVEDDLSGYNTFPCCSGIQGLSVALEYSCRAELDLILLKLQTGFFCFLLLAPWHWLRSEVIFEAVLSVVLNSWTVICMLMLLVSGDL